MILFTNCIIFITPRIIDFSRTFRVISAENSTVSMIRNGIKLIRCYSKKGSIA